MNYYNDCDPACAQWLLNLIKAGHLPPGDVDERSIKDVRADELVGYTGLHFFCGIGGWPLAARLAGWPDSREIFTGSCPCQPFSVAGKGAGTADERHLWPYLFRIISARRPAAIFGEQVAAAIGKDWFDGVRADMESIGYAVRGFVIPACAVNAPHRRDRLWFVAGSSVLDNCDDARLEGFARDVADRAGWACQDRSIAATGGGIVGHSEGEREHRRQDSARQNGGIGAEAASCDVADSHATERRSDMAGRNDADRDQAGRQQSAGDITERGAWDDSAWIIGHDGKARRVGMRVRGLSHGLPAEMAGLRAGQSDQEKEMIPLLAHGERGRVAKLRGLGNAIVPQVAAEIIAAWMECMP